MTTEPDRPIKLRVGYKSPESLLAAFAQSVGRGSVELPSRKDLPPGTRFLFEMLSASLRQPVQVFGVVSGSRPVEEGFLLTVHYEAPGDRAGLDAALRELFDAHSAERGRTHARVPMHLTAAEHKQGAPGYRVKDVSRGGMGLEVEDAPLPDYVKEGTPVFVQVTTSDGTVGLHGEVAWVRPSRPSETAPAFGIQFGRLQGSSQLALDRLVVLYGLPSGPWRAEVSFGMDAVEKMP